MGIWVARSANGSILPGGRYRQFEAFSNCDLDPLHVSSYHAIPYGTFFPVSMRFSPFRAVSVSLILANVLAQDLAANTLVTGWAAYQNSGGMVQEFLGGFATGDGRLTGTMDTSAGGRTMADVTSVLILYSALVWKNTGDESFLREIYPSVSRAASWHIQRASSGVNGSFPSYLQVSFVASIVCSSLITK